MKMNDLRTNGRMEIQGVWVDIGDGGKLLIARANNLLYLAKYRELTKPYWNQMRSGNMPLDETTKIYVQCLAETILLGWEGVEDGDPLEPVPYSVAKATEYLTNIADFRELVTTISEQQFRYREADLENGAKNS